MTTRRVVLYAEGANESAGAITTLPAVGVALDDAHLGAAHVLVRRILAAEALSLIHI